MTASLAPSAAPPWAIRVWSDSEFIYAELPAKDGGLPYVMKHAHTDAGLNKILSLMKREHKAAGAKAYSAISREPLRSKAFSEGQREATRQVLKRLKII